MKLPFAFACGFVFAFALGCGGANPVDDIIKEQRAIIEMQKTGKIDTARIDAVEKKVANLTNAQKEEYAKRIAKEIQSLVPAVKMPEVPGVAVPKVP